jgi:hypothetical protein
MALSLEQQITNAVADVLKKVRDVKVVYQEGEALGEKRNLFPCFFLMLGESASEFFTNKTFLKTLSLNVVFVTNKTDDPVSMLNKYIDYTQKEIFKDIRFGLRNVIEHFEIEDTRKGLGKDFFEEGKTGIDPNFPMFIMTLLIEYEENIGENN